MRKIVEIGSIFALWLAIAAPVDGQAMSYPIGARGWTFDVTTTIPLAKIVESTDPGASVDVVPFVAFGGGLTTYWVDKNDTLKVKIVSFNFPIVAVSVRENNVTKLDLTVIADVGFFDNKVRLGAGYYLGKRADGESRFVGVFSVGTNLFQ